MEPALLIIVLGVNMTLWTLIGGLRLGTEKLGNGSNSRRAGPYCPATVNAQTLSPDDVAVLIPAHNEEPVIAATIESVLRLVPAAQIHVIADGCADGTADIARAIGVNVLELIPGRGKAGGIEAAVQHFDLPARFAAVLILDADTTIDAHYLERGLPLLGTAGVVALAGYAKAGWRPRELSPPGRFLISYRTRLYAVMQWLKYGQTWRWTNVTAIVPGFASMYRTSVLGAMELNPPGLIIEDFNMTFEIHHKRLGKIAFRPGVFATTQDPDNFRDYYRQVFRWQLGFWQTVRRHGFWASGFSLALALFLAEVLIASLGIVLLVAALASLTPFVLAGFALAAMGTADAPHGLAQIHVSLLIVLLAVAALDYVVTCLTAFALRRPSMLLYGAGFLALRFADATAALWALPHAWLVHSDGQWTSPVRRPVAAPPKVPDSSRDGGRR
ncbi:glycosyltransferase family 2 protein [Phytoactinopolyspora alkaliphila]|uniref:Glycosyltransferase family 2 protein n=1 Tax=Phytoactinopolyspora alkaliphila TaxID=1783498 RepID=A0A6N9YU78_9ACTN|nr:glycosyltransferase family 2 protein [Phytoactinopolyspora alkaliphila]NED98524.1 glycosyltransferase family 2 protein [Phytoactinopolyspora alkaliphila]